MDRKDLPVYLWMTPPYLLRLRWETHSATDTGTGDSSSNTGEEEDWDRMDLASGLDAAANAL